MNRMVLNADVLLLVFSLAHKQTKLALMSTCQVLYREGGRQFLKSENVGLGRENRLKSFLRFIDADGGSRMRSLGRLTLDINLSLSLSVAKRFRKLLERLGPVSRLTDLTILCLEPLLSSHPSLAKAIAGLTSLKDVDFQHVGKLSLKMLKSMKSELETADIGFERSKGDRDTSEDFIISLAQYSSSLRCLAVRGDTGYNEDPRDDDPRYPHVSDLTLDEPESHITWHYTRAFPNLKKLSVVTMNHGLYDPDEAFRAENVAQLRRHGCWESLDSFDGAVIMLWMLGLSCPVSELSLEGDCRITPDIFRTCLVPTRATRLRISIFQFSLFLDEEFIQAFEEGCAATLKVLELDLQIYPDEYRLEGYDLDLGEVLVSRRAAKSRH